MIQLSDPPWGQRNPPLTEGMSARFRFGSVRWRLSGHGAGDVFVSFLFFMGLYMATNWVIKPNIVFLSKFGPRSASHNFAKFKAYVIN